MTRVMDILEEYFELREYKFCRLDGSVSNEERQKAIRDFNKEDSEYFVFILSTRAGGLGVNLQSADTVILFDSDWNPQADKQAQARTHRIGQTRQVLSIRFLCVGSVEEKIIARANSKLKMEQQLITAGKFDYTTGKKEQEQFFDLILRQDSDIEEEKKEVPSDEEVNELISRGTEELKMFNEIDIKTSTSDNFVKLQAKVSIPEWLVVKEKKPKYATLDFDETTNLGKRKRSAAPAVGSMKEEDIKTVQRPRKKTKPKKGKKKKSSMKRRLSSEMDDFALMDVCQLCNEPCKNFEDLQMHMLTSCQVYADVLKKE